jgi:hypothetical protein
LRRCTLSGIKLCAGFGLSALGGACAPPSPIAPVLSHALAGGFALPALADSTARRAHPAWARGRLACLAGGLGARDPHAAAQRVAARHLLHLPGEPGSRLRRCNSTARGIAAPPRRSSASRLVLLASTSRRLASLDEGRATRAAGVAAAADAGGGETRGRDFRGLIRCEGGVVAGPGRAGCWLGSRRMLARVAPDASPGRTGATGAPGSRAWARRRSGTCVGEAAVGHVRGRGGGRALGRAPDRRTADRRRSGSGCAARLRRGSGVARRAGGVRRTRVDEMVFCTCGTWASLGPADGGPVPERFRLRREAPTGQRGRAARGGRAAVTGGRGRARWYFALRAPGPPRTAAPPSDTEAALAAPRGSGGAVGSHAARGVRRGRGRVRWYFAH